MKKINNLKLDKEKYYYWIDKQIIVDFEILFWQDDISENNIKVSYGYNLFWQTWLNSKHKYVGFQDNKVKINKVLWTNRYSFQVPVMIFNLNREELNEYIGIQNFIHIEVEKWEVFKIHPEIVLDEGRLHIEKQLRNFHLRYKKNPDKTQHILSHEEVSNAINAVNFFSDKNKNLDNNIKLQTEFRWLFSTFFINIRNNNLLSDYISHNFYNHLNSKIDINIFLKLIESQIFNFIYKYSIFPPMIIWLDLIFGRPIYNYIWNIIPYYLFVSLGVFFLIFFMLTKLYERYAKKRIQSFAYNIELLKPCRISENLKHRLFSKKLQIGDIFDSFSVNDRFLWWKYLFSINLNCYIKSYYHDRSSKIENIMHLFSLDLFYESNKSDFNINSIKLLDNNYSMLEDFLPKDQKVQWYWKSNWVEIYYTLDYQLDSIWLPNTSATIPINFNFDN